MTLHTTLHLNLIPLSRRIARRFLVPVLLLTMLVGFGNRAAADEVLNLSPNPSYNSGNTFSYNLTLTQNGTTVKAYPGPYFFSVNSPPAGVGSTISTFCIDALHNVNTNSSANYSVVSLTSSSTTISKYNPTDATQVANAIEALYGKYYQTSWGTLSGASNSPASLAAFQLALFELVYDGTSDLANPSATNYFSPSSSTLFSSTDPNAATAQKWLTQVINNTAADDALFTSGLGENASLVVLCSSGYQNQIWLQPTPPGPSVSTPVPPTAILGGIALLGLIGRARFNKAAVAPV